MPILTGDIKLLASQVMDDVPEGGGAPTAIVIADGASNAIFNDISEMDRGGGRVAMRKLHVSVQTDDRSTYLGSNLIVAEPPADPNVSITLLTTNSTFDTRAEAVSRVESYLNKGTLWAGYLYENHIAGQRSIQIFQRPEAELPAIGQTMVLVKREGFSDQEEQYIRSTSAVSVIGKFYDPDTQKDFDAAVVTMGISDALRIDMPGSPPSRGFGPLITAAKLRDTVVADAGTYVGVTGVALAAELGDYTVTTKGIYTQLVPSAQTEVPISDVRTNGLSAALVPSGAPETLLISTALTTTTSLHVGSPITPATLTISALGITAVDTGGVLTVAGTEVGQVDYDNGIVSMSTNTFGTGGTTFTVIFTPATVPELVSDQTAIYVSAESRSLNYTFVMGRVPVRRTLNVSYLAQGRWYVLRDNGAGVLKGVSSAYGTGTLNYSTGSVQITLGALPDVGSSLIVQSYSTATAVEASNTYLANSGKVFVPMNTDGALSTVKGSKPFKKGSVLIGWTDSGVAKTAIDNGSGTLTGDATGVINYGNGVVLISPNTLPTPGTLFTLSNAAPPPEAQGLAVGVVLVGGNLGATSIDPGSVSFDLFAQLLYGWSAGPASKLSFTQRNTTMRVTDDGAGNLMGLVFTEPTPVGTINYATGAITWTGITNYSLGYLDPGGPQLLVPEQVSFSSVVGSGVVIRSVTAPAYSIPWAQDGVTTGGRSFSAVFATSANISYASTGAGGEVDALAEIAVSSYLLSTAMVDNYTLKGVRFKLGSTQYAELTDGTLVANVSPVTGGGTPAGVVSGSLGLVNITLWPVGAAPTVVNWRGVISPPSVGVLAPFTSYGTTFRTAASPLRPGSVSVLGTLQDGTTFNVTASTLGKINGTRVKGTVDYQYGLVTLYFVNPAGDSAYNVDLSHLQIAGLTTIPADLGMLGSLRYNAVAFSYLPLDATLLGIDPVRLPSDGRVPIFRAGGFAVVGHTGKVTATVSNGQTIDCARVRLSRVRVVGDDGTVIHTGYTTDLDAGTVTFANVSGYSQPVTIEHRIEDMGVVRDVQISGEVTFTRPLTHDYPLGSFVSSALVAGDLKSRVSTFFDQATWSNVWSDTLIGSAATGTYNNIASPLVVTNAGAITERWALVFTSSTTFNVVGEHVGVIGTGSTGTDTSPLNPITGVPYLTIPALGWGTGWAVGNVLRLNTVGAMAPVWVVRTVQQGPNTGTEHSFTLLSRGDVDRP